MRLSTLLTQLFCIIGVYFLLDYFGIVRFFLDGLRYPQQAFDFATLQLYRLTVPIPYVELQQFCVFFAAVLAWGLALCSQAFENRHHLIKN